MKKIRLSAGKNAKIDDEWFDRLNKYSWHAYFDGWNWYARRTTTVNKKSKTFLMHREVLGVTDSKVYVDHIDHDGLNNQASNLRKCTPSQNKKNTKGRGSSKYLGVSRKTTKLKYTKKSGEEMVYIVKSWEARIQHEKKQISLGFFKNEEDAAKAYDKKAIELHGEFANINFK